MSLLDGCESRDLTDFTGPNLLVDEEDVTSPQGRFAQDVEYLPGQVRTRRGFGQAFIPGGTLPGRIVNSIYNWVQQKYNRLVYLHSGTTVISRDLIANTEDSPILTGLSARGMICAQAGYRLFLSLFTNDASTNAPVGATEARCWDGTYTSGTPNVEKLYPRAPLATEMSLSFAEPGPAGFMDAGLHYFGVLGQSWGGGLTPPGPAPSSLSFDYTVAPSFTSTGGKQLTITLTPAATWPTWLNTLQIIMTPIANPNRWFAVPGAVVSVPRGGALPINVTISISDVTLTGRADLDVVNAGYFSLLTQSSSNSGPFSPHVLIAYNNRLVALFQSLGPDGLSTVSTIAISNQFQPQWISAAKNLLYLPEFRQATTGFVLGNALFILGPGWTFAFTDNTQIPVLWAQPRTVSLSIGTPFPRGVLANTTKGYSWVAAADGLYYFEGQRYPDLPASYFQTPDWLSINFSAPPESLAVHEDPNRRLIMVKAPVGAAQQTANKLLVWDYTKGKTPDKIQYCGMWSIQKGAVAIGDIAAVYNPANKNWETWLSRITTAGKIFRQKYYPADGSSLNDPTIYSDDGVGINSQFQYGPLWGVSTGKDQHIALNFKVSGNGTANITSYEQGQSNLATHGPITGLTAYPIRRFMLWLNRQATALSIQMDNGGVDQNYFVWAAVKCWRKKWMEWNS